MIGDIHVEGRVGEKVKLEIDTGNIPIEVCLECTFRRIVVMSQQHKALRFHNEEGVPSFSGPLPCLKRPYHRPYCQSDARQIEGFHGFMPYCIAEACTNKP